MKNIFVENLNHLIIKDFWMIKIWPYFHKSIWVAIIIFANIFVPKTYFLKVLDGALFLWIFWVFF
jgi:hypothetical protein